MQTQTLDIVKLILGVIYSEILFYTSVFELNQYNVKQIEKNQKENSSFFSFVAINCSTTSLGCDAILF